WLTISASNENLQYYIDIKDVKAMSGDAHETGLRVKGKLVPGSLVRTPNSLEVKFVIAQETDELEVRYNKELPDTFKDGSEVLVEGKYTAAGYFDANMLMAKCPSKYESTEGYESQYGTGTESRESGTY
ncbi:cytochrome c maturation protein CcmE, partial [bacterium]|nr:cytochrome c maturation protein CcmE [bacterium]